LSPAAKAATIISKAMRAPSRNPAGSNSGSVERIRSSPAATASGGFVVGNGGCVSAPRAPSGTTLLPIFSLACSAVRETESGRLSWPVRRPKTLRSRSIRNAATIANKIMSK
jgi:hypothetical protein